MHDFHLSLLNCMAKAKCQKNKVGEITVQKEQSIIFKAIERGINGEQDV